MPEQNAGFLVCPTWTLLLEIVKSLEASSNFARIPRILFLCLKGLDFFPIKKNVYPEPRLRHCHVVLPAFLPQQSHRFFRERSKTHQVLPWTNPKWPKSLRSSWQLSHKGRRTRKTLQYISTIVDTYSSNSRQHSCLAGMSLPFSCKYYNSPAAVGRPKVGVGRQSLQKATGGPMVMRWGIDDIMLYI